MIDRNRMCWNLETIEPWIDLETKERILQMPICETGGRDELIWPYDVNGTYSVKSGYKVLMKGKLVNAASNGSTSHWVNKRVWMGIWKLEV